MAHRIARELNDFAASGIDLLSTKDGPALVGLIMDYFCEDSGVEQEDTFPLPDSRLLHE